MVRSLADRTFQLRFEDPFASENESSVRSSPKAPKAKSPKAPGAQKKVKKTKTANSGVSPKKKEAQGTASGYVFFLFWLTFG